MVDGDPQGSLSISLGNPQPDKLPVILSNMMEKVLMDGIQKLIFLILEERLRRC